MTRSWTDILRSTPFTTVFGPLVADTAQAAQVRVRGVDATVIYRAHDDECARRHAAGLTGVPRLDQLDLLMDMPAGHPVPLTSFSREDRRELRALPAGCIAYHGNDVVRLATPPLTLQLVVIEAARWSQAALARVGKFGTYSTRILALETTPADLHFRQMEADLEDFGLITNTAKAAQPQVAPKPIPDWTPTPATWLLAEQIFHQLRDPAGPKGVAA